MASATSARDLIAEARGTLLTLMQENDTANGFASPEWAEEMFEATQHLRDAELHLTRAALYA